MDAVLGLSMTPTSVGLVLVEGQDADGATMDRDAFDVYDGALPTCEQATAAVLRTEALAANRGRRLHSIGVTWSEDADAEASALMKSLSESGFDNVVPIRLPEATEALARGMAAVIGYETTAVCVIEPDSVISIVVNTVRRCRPDRVQPRHRLRRELDQLAEHGVHQGRLAARRRSSWSARRAVSSRSCRSSRMRCRCPYSHRRKPSSHWPGARHWPRLRPSNFRWSAWTTRYDGQFAYTVTGDGTAGRHRTAERRRASVWAKAVPRRC